MTEPKVSQEQLEIMRHTVGLDNNETPYRNHFVTGEYADNYQCLRDIEAQGLMKSYTRSFCPDDVIFALTEDGCRMIGLSGLDAIPN